MTDREVGFYHRCLNLAWINDGLPADEKELARVMRVTPAYLRKVWKRISLCWYEEDGRLRNIRQEEERKSANEKSEKRSSSATLGQKDGPGFIYFARRTEGSVKIGSTNNVARRLAQIRYRCQDMVVLVKKLSVSSMVKEEVRIHKLFENKRISGEWYALSQEDIDSITPGVIDGGDSTYHPSSRAYDYVSVSVSSKENSSSSKRGVQGGEFRVTKLISPDRFQEWLKPWPRVSAVDAAAQAWISVINGTEDESKAFAARDRYLASAEVARNVIMEPARWLYEQARGNWEGKWPAPAAPPKMLSVTERAIQNWEAKHKNGTS